MRAQAGPPSTTGKLTRAEPVAALYEQGRVSHIGHHPELEEQLVSFTGASGERSPDRLDAATWAITDLMGYGLRREHVDLQHRRPLLRPPDRSDGRGVEVTC